VVSQSEIGALVDGYAKLFVAVDTLGGEQT
jgi:hypothetical protein